LGVWTSTLTFFRTNPIIGLLTTVAALVSVPLTILLYFASQQTRDLVFTVHPARTIIARAGRPSELKVDFKGEIIKSDVVGVQVALWNQGKRSVHPSDILSSIEIRLNPSAPILQVSVAKTSRSVIALAFGNDAEMLRQGRVPVNFKILEQGDGGSVQIIYAGPSDIDVSLVGVVEGAGAPRNLRATVVGSPTELSIPSVRDRTLQSLARWFFVVFFLGLVLNSMGEMIRYIHASEKRNGFRLFVDGFLLTLYIVLGCIYLFFVPSFPTPPFGF
jgi:hypothetical protein